MLRCATRGGTGADLRRVERLKAGLRLCPLLVPRPFAT
jgi:hypothetical protein